MPVLVVRAPGWQPLAIGSPDGRSWRGEVPEEAPGYVVSDEDWPALVDSFGLGPQLSSRRSRTAGGRLARGRRRLGMGAWFGRIAFACRGLFLLYLGVNDMHRYHDGTPATVTVTHCGTGKGSTCGGTWTVDGVSQTGSIERGFSSPAAGSSLEARVWGHTAYMSTSPYPSFAWGAVITVGVAVSFVRRRKR